ncbi:MAG TPA: DUF4911 domain-containing protein [Polyangia bacterium]|nr:DUF4911 domain-containing protein [Polyangia bacterium]
MPSRYYRVPLEQIAYVRAVVEGYDGVAVLRALDPRRGEVELVIGEGLEDEALAIAARLAVEAGLVEIARPPDWDSLAPDERAKMPAP